MVYEVGQKVIISMNPNEQIHSDQEIWDYQGMDSKVVMRKIIAYGLNNTRRGVYYQLEGVKSSKGLPFSFLEEQLIPINA